jgi:hypothetical protein
VQQEKLEDLWAIMDEIKEKRCSFALIDSLCVELCEVKIMPHPLKRVIPWIIIACAYVLASVYFMGLRSDIASQMIRPIYVFELFLISAVAISAAFCAIWLCVPDMRGQRWMLAVPTSLFASFLIWTGLRAGLEHFNVPHVQWHICYLEAIIFGALPAVAIFVLSMRGKTTHPYLLSLMNTLAVGGFGYLGLRLTCASEDIAHICIFHIAPYALFGLFASLFGRRIYRW